MNDKFYYFDGIAEICFLFNLVFFGYNPKTRYFANSVFHK